MMTDTAETIIAPRRPKRSSLIRTSENKQKLRKRQYPRRHDPHLFHITYTPAAKYGAAFTAANAQMRLGVAAHVVIP